jgi:Transposase
VLGVGIDWAEEFHLVALGRPDEGVIEVRRVDHSRAGVGALLRHIAKLEPDAAAVRVVIEARHGLLVEALVDAGFTVVAVNPSWCPPPRAGRQEGRCRRCPHRMPTGPGSPRRAHAAGPPR